LTVCFASEKVLWLHKQRKSSLPDEHKRALIGAFRMVDEVVVGEGMEEGVDFKEHFLKIRPQILAVTEDDKYGPIKRELCKQVGARYVILPKTPPKFTPVSTSQLVKYIRAPREVPVRVDFAGGWLDVPAYAKQGAFVVNCAVSPTVSLQEWNYERNAGLGGSGAWALLNGEDGVKSEINLGIGWQDPAVIEETGLCVWHSGSLPKLEIKVNGDWLRGRMALYWTGREHDTPGCKTISRDYELIVKAGQLARDAVWAMDYGMLVDAVKLSYRVQLAEGMMPLPGDETCRYLIRGKVDECRPLAWKYCGGGHGGYALYLFKDETDRERACAIPGFRPIEPFIKNSVLEST